jgi:hypothetical protein
VVAPQRAVPLAQIAMMSYGAWTLPPGSESLEATNDF